MSAKILVVDDSATDRLIIKNMLSEYNILTASDGFDALRVINAHADIDLVILDLKMPNMNGFQVLDAFKSDDRYKKLRTIILTNYDELDNEIKGLELGAIDYIRKPINLESLKVRIDIHLELLRVQQLLEQELYEQSFTFDTILQQAPIGIAISHNSEPVITVNKEIIVVNAMFEKITGRTKAELIRLGWGKITHPDDLEEDLRNYRKLQAGEIKSYAMEKRFIKPDGSIVWVHMVVAPLTLSDDNKYKHICLAQDITQRKETQKALAESERSKAVLLAHLPGLAYRCQCGCDWTMQYVSAGCLSLTGYPAENLLYNRDMRFNDLIVPEYRELVQKEWARVLVEKQPFKYEYEIITAAGERKWVLDMGEGAYNDNGEVEAIEGIILDISDRKEIERILKYNNDHDEWTGLYNRRFLEKLLEHDAEIKVKMKRAVIAINLSAMYTLRMTYGFQYSQELIKKIADSLFTVCSDTSLLFYTHENQFVYYLLDYGGKTELTAFCEAIANKLESLLAVERIGGGIGIVEIDEENKNAVDQILKDLLIASEKATDTFDRDFGYCFYDTEMETRLIREDIIKNELVQATEENDDRLFLQFQPVVDLKLNRICGFEALARLKSVELGMVPPLEFIPIAEKTKLIIPLGEKILLKAFHFLNTLKKNGYDKINVSINISAIQLLRSGFVGTLREMIVKTQVDPENISLELTESIFASNYKEINSILRELQEMKINIAIDDFGTGYSSLARERELCVDCVKIDKSFIDKLLILEEEAAITGDIISMAHKLGHYVVAEGVEYEKQRQYLKDHSCDKIQGYLINKPMDDEAALDLLSKYE